MPVRIETLIVMMAILCVLLLCILSWALQKIRDISFDRNIYRDLAHDYFHQACEYAQERDIALSRAESRCSYWILRRDERIESLEAENRALRDAMQEV